MSSRRPAGSLGTALAASWAVATQVLAAGISAAETAMVAVAVAGRVIGVPRRKKSGSYVDKSCAGEEWEDGEAGRQAMMGAAEEAGEVSGRRTHVPLACHVATEQSEAERERGRVLSRLRNFKFLEIEATDPGDDDAAKDDWCDNLESRFPGLAPVVHADDSCVPMPPSPKVDARKEVPQVRPYSRTEQ